MVQRKKRILITGSNGLLGRRITEFYKKQPGFIVLAASRDEESLVKDVEYYRIDLCDKKAVKELVKYFFPDYIVNTAAFTHVDNSEVKREEAWQSNVTAVEYLAMYAITSQAKLIHFSSDYIFDGKTGPYDESVVPNPVNYYGRSKFAAENILRIANIDYAVIRTNVIYGLTDGVKNDFVKWVITSLKAGKEIKIVNDQINNPAFTEDLSEAVHRIIEYNKNGVYNIGGPVFLSRYEFTLKIAEYFNLPKSLVKPITTAEFNQLAVRPLSSGLITLKAETELGLKPRSLEETFRLINENERYK